MTANELRSKYIDFFVRRGHIATKGASLVPENDPTVLFTTAGMHPLVPFLLGEKHPCGKRLVNYQKCIRTGDIDEVGDDVHLTFFEMLGNWSFGDYFKEEAIRYSFDFLTSPEYLDIPQERLAVSVFAGDKDAPFDKISHKIWLALGIAPARIARLGKKNNWWGPAGTTGPCGPDTEMFYWVGEKSPPKIFDHQDPLWIEIWNDVFMEYEKTSSGEYRPLKQRNVDTGMGVERVTAILQGKKTVYDTELFTPIFEEITRLSSSKNPQEQRSGRVIAEHLRSATFILADGISPSNVDQGYVLRRLIRRAIGEGKKLGIQGEFTCDLAKTVIKIYADTYPELEKKRHFIYTELIREEKQFARTIEKGLREFQRMIDGISGKQISGKKAFFLYETYGFPLDLTKEMAREKGLSVDEKEFQDAYQKHQERSRKGAEGKFKGGLADHSKETTKLHTATHLLHQALRLILGDHVAQKGSNITKERLRFDFCHPQKLTREQLQAIESLVNEQIQNNLPIIQQEMTVEQARKKGAIGLFGERYGDQVRVYSIGDFSREICGGPHINNTQEIGTLKIVKEESSSRGVRRIKAIVKL